IRTTATPATPIIRSSHISRKRPILHVCVEDKDETQNRDKKRHRDTRHETRDPRPETRDKIPSYAPKLLPIQNEFHSPTTNHRSRNPNHNLPLLVPPNAGTLLL
ncbi:hypothetical protein E4U54_002494, partial [Claviceps lovelessii]